jgi:Putative translation initiation inhibitor, yjgF family
MKTQIVHQNNTLLEISDFQPEKGLSECQVMIHITEATLPYCEQLKSIFDSFDELLSGEFCDARVVFQRIFLSDAANQVDALHNYLPDNNNISIIEQPPLDGTKIALWAYMIKGTDIITSSENDFHSIHHGKYKHLLKCSAINNDGNSEKQTRQLLDNYITLLKKHNCTLDTNCIRTWIFVQNVDLNYQGVVKARKEVFAENGLSSETHFIASTGIGGRHRDKETLVVFDFYAIEGIKKEQIQYLYAKTHLNPTYEYGVTFERGTCIYYGDRRHVFISGTASINNKGEIVHPGNIEMQAMRMIENVEALLKEADCDFDDVSQMIIYLRDIADYQVARIIIDKRFPLIPKIIVFAPVCRAGWLIEMECFAVKEVNDDRFDPL